MIQLGVPAVKLKQSSITSLAPSGGQHPSDAMQLQLAGERTQVALTLAAAQKNEEPIHIPPLTDIPDSAGSSALIEMINSLRLHVQDLERRMTEMDGRLVIGDKKRV